MWHVEPSIVSEVDNSEKLKLFGAVLFEEYGNDEVRLNMWSAIIEEEEDESLQLDYF